MCPKSHRLPNTDCSAAAVRYCLEAPAPTSNSYRLSKFGYSLLSKYAKMPNWEVQFSILRLNSFKSKPERSNCAENFKIYFLLKIVIIVIKAGEIIIQKIQVIIEAEIQIVIIFD